MTYELELKFRLLSEASLAALIRDSEVSSYLAFAGEKAMAAAYYDTKNRDLSTLHAGLRLRKEGAETVCCLKLRGDPVGGAKKRPEYECAAPSVSCALPAFRSLGVPEEILHLLESRPLEPVCEITFTRRIWLYRRDRLEIEFAADSGMFSGANGTLPLSEIEMEKKSGEDQLFLTFCTALAARHGLMHEPRSKLSRALSLCD